VTYKTSEGIVFFDPTRKYVWSLLNSTKYGGAWKDYTTWRELTKVEIVYLKLRGELD